MDATPGGLPGSGGAAILKPRSFSVLGCTAGVREGGVYVDQVCHPLDHFSSSIFLRPCVARK